MDLKNKIKLVYLICCLISLTIYTWEYFRYFYHPQPKASSINSEDPFRKLLENQNQNLVTEKSGWLNGDGLSGHGEWCLGLSYDELNGSELTVKLISKEGTVVCSYIPDICPKSSQRKHWMFKDEQELQNMRITVNRKYILEHRESLQPNAQQAMLSDEEERYLIRYYEFEMRDFCKKFEPTMPRAVLGTAFNYFKRFYLNNSVMNFHPKEILVTCVYLACKVEEFNVSIKQFTANIRSNSERAADIIINNELLLMQQLNYQLTVHNPFRPVEGFLIDIKVRSRLNNPEKLRTAIDELLDRLYLTDACLLYSPSQIALASILHSASKNQENLDAYVTQTLLGGDSSRLTDLIEAVRNIRSLVKITAEVPSREVVRNLEKRLEVCRNEENNPDSQVYKERMAELIEDDEERAARRYAKVSRLQAQTEAHILGVTPLEP